MLYLNTCGSSTWVRNGVFMRKLFGTDGIRGEANRYPMTPDLVLKLGQAIGKYFKRHYPKPMILIGKDTRRSCYMLEQALGSGICSVGVDVNLLGPLPTSGISYLTRGLRACAGIVISASHNPYYDNGIKIFSSDGYKLPDSEENVLEHMVLEEKIDLVSGFSIGKAKRIDDAVGQYAVFLKEQFPKHLSLEGMRIVLDCANGAAYKVAPKVFTELGAEVFLLGITPDGKNINDGCGALYPEKLQQQVKLYKADIGLALDGDADRLILVDDTHKIVDGDQILAVCSKAMIEHGELSNNTVVSTVMSNIGLDIALESFGGQVVRTQVGDRYVVEKMKEIGANLGGEQSGHLIFRDCATTGDGILAALSVLKVIKDSGQKLSELKKCISLFPQVLKNFSVDKKIPLENLPKLKGVIESIESKLNSGSSKGRVLFRYSGTENLARVMIEGEDTTTINTYMDEIVSCACEEIKSVTSSKN